jgi:hypothetical protein
MPGPDPSATAIDIGFRLPGPVERLLFPRSLHLKDGRLVPRPKDGRLNRAGA